MNVCECDKGYIGDDCGKLTKDGYKYSRDPLSSDAPEE